MFNKSVAFASLHKIAFNSLLLGVWQLLFFGILAQSRLVDRDEGFYLMAAKLISQGAQPYSDFFFLQMPLLPYIWAAWIKIFGTSWLAARWLCAVFSAILGTLLYHDLKKRSGLGWGLFGLILYCSSSLVFPWFLTVKTFALSGLLLYAAYYWCQHWRDRPRAIFLSGLALGLAATTRAYLAPVPLLFLCWSYLAQKQFAARTWLFAALGLILGTSPAWLHFWQAPELFLFDNWQVHQLRAESLGGPRAWQDKINLLLGLLGLRDLPGLWGQQLPILLWVSALYFLLCCYTRVSIDFAWFLVLGLFAICFLPSPNYTQYFSICLPFLILLATQFLAALNQTLAPKFRPLFLLLIAYALANYYLPTFPRDLKRYTQTGLDVTGVGGGVFAQTWRLQNVIKVNRLIDQQIAQHPNKIVYSSWPGYIFEGAALPLPGLENQWGPKFAELAPVQQRQLAKLKTRAELRHYLTEANTRPPLAVTYVRDANPKLHAWLNNLGYQEIAKVGRTRIFQLE